jgi:hypothetical protein
MVVVDQHGVWRSPETGAVGEDDVACRFLVGGGRVVQFARYNDLAVALQEAMLGEPDEVSGR